MVDDRRPGALSFPVPRLLASAANKKYGTVAATNNKLALENIIIVFFLPSNFKLSDEVVIGGPHCLFDVAYSFAVEGNWGFLVVQC